MVAIITPCRSAPSITCLGVVLGTGLTTRTAHERADPQGEETLGLLPRLERDLNRLFRRAKRLVPAAGQVLHEAEVRHDPWERTPLAPFIGEPSQRGKDRARLVELVGPREVDRERERCRAREGREGRLSLETHASGKRLSPSGPTEHGVDDAVDRHAQRSVSGCRHPFGRCERALGMPGRLGKVFSQEEQGISDAFLQPRAQREVDPRLIEGGSEELNRARSIALVFLKGPSQESASARCAPGEIDGSVSSSRFRARLLSPISNAYDTARIARSIRSCSRS